MRLPRDEFFAQVKLGKGRVVLNSKHWADAERVYAEIVGSHPDTESAAEALYWQAVCQYRVGKDHAVLHQLYPVLQQKYPESIWTEKASVWKS